MPAITPPPRLTFWRIILLTLATLAALSIADWLFLAQKLGITIITSKSWMLLLAGLGAISVFSLAAFALTLKKVRRALLNGIFPGEKLSRSIEWIQAVWGSASFPISSFIFFLSSIALPALILYPPSAKLLSDQTFTRLLIFLVSALLGAAGLMNLAKLGYPAAFAASAMLAALIFRIAMSAATVTDYPFSMGWSETSRFYWPSLFLSPTVYGQRIPWPILHPTLHLVLIPPYLIDAPLWLHRAWQEFLRTGLLAALALVLVARLKPQHKWLSALWMTLFLLQGPVYYHLVIPVMLVLWGYSEQNQRRTWITLLLASIYCGWSRVNWWPMPGMLMAVLYFLEVPGEKNPIKYLIKPASYFFIGLGTAFLAQRGYIALSGISNPADFYTSFTSALLWYRLMPNASFSLGIIPGLVLVSLPLWMLLATRIRTLALGGLRLTFILAAVSILLVGGVIVSLKIGGGADLHNIDAYLVMLLLVGAWGVRRTTPNGDFSSDEKSRLTESSPVARCDAPSTERLKPPLPVHWLLITALVAVPVWFNIQGKASFKVYDPAEAQNTLQAIQTYASRAQNNGGEVLFITQRHLVSMKMISGVQLTIPEYEREELMEMAMAQNQPYLNQFENELRAHRFALIIVDPLRTDTVGKTYGMAEEQNVWNRFVAKPILRFYCPVFISETDRVALYAPRVDGTACLP